MPTEADPQTLSRLLELQSEDSAVRRLTERRAALPEAQRLAEVAEALRELEDDLQIAIKQRDELQRAQQRLEGEIGVVDSKIQRDERRMFSGNVANPRELSNLQAEVDMHKRKRAQLEDELLEAMLQIDHAEATLQSVSSERDATSSEHDGLSATVADLLAQIDRELAAHQSVRTETAGTIPDNLLALYERLRAAKQGVGAAALERDTCTGCHTRLPAKELERMRAEGGLQRCDNCRRILVIR